MTNQFYKDDGMLIENKIVEMAMKYLEGDILDDGMQIPFVKPTIGPEEMVAVNRVLCSGNLGPGKEVAAFEEEFAKFVGVKYAIFTGSCTQALKMAYKWFKEREDAKYQLPTVLMEENTYNATYSAAHEMGIDVQFRWLDKRKGDQLNPKLKDMHTLEELSELGDSIVVVHYGGIKRETPCVIEDSAHRIEPNDPLIGKIRCYSFHPTKNMTSIQGGMFVTDDKEIYEKARLWSRDGREGGWNYKTTAFAGGYEGNEICAAVGREQLKKVQAFNKTREKIVSAYNDAFGLNWKGNHLYPIKGSIRFGNKLREQGIEVFRHYPGFTDTISLPLYPTLGIDQIEYIIEKVKDGLRRK